MSALTPVRNVIKKHEPRHSALRTNNNNRTTRLSFRQHHKKHRIDETYQTPSLRTIEASCLKQPPIDDTADGGNRPTRARALSKLSWSVRNNENLILAVDEKKPDTHRPSDIVCDKHQRKAADQLCRCAPKTTTNKRRQDGKRREDV